MFVRQAARQIELFTGLTPDIAIMREIMRKALSPLTRAFESEDEEKEQNDEAENTTGEDVTE